MKNSIIKIAAFGIIMMMLLSIIQLQAFANTDEENIILKKADKEFIIYQKDLCNEEFQFAFSKVNTTKEEDLNLINSAKDSLKEDALNIAYIDETLYTNFFTDGSAYLWIKNSTGFVVKAELIDLINAIDNDLVATVNNTTKRIAVHTAVSETTTQKVDGVDKSVSVGKIVLDSKEGSYYYQLVRLEGASEDYATLFELAELLQEGVTGTYNQLVVTKQFYTLYNKLAPKMNDTNWTEVDNYEVLQPENTKQDEKYIVWLKDDSDVIDAQFLKSTYNFDEVKELEQIVIKETVKLPVTYDSIALFVVLGVLIIAIAVISILKIRSNKKVENK